ncbi:MAG: hypothetical protein JW781_08535 [Deltaproteobacteria bacterium]|nr:hypothetical protein [Candidatus Anaeroferrophillacea bacterium]
MTGNYMPIRRAVEHHDPTFSSLNINIMFKANKLPWHHRDPADHFIIATAMREKAGIVTGDHAFADYDVEVMM